MADKRSPEQAEAMLEQPRLATIGLIVVSVVGIIGIVVIRLYVGVPPTGLVALTSTAVAGLVMSSGKRRF